MLLVGFMATRTGRWVRILAGSGMVVGGLASGSPKGAALALAGLGSLVSGAMDVCMMAALFGHSIRGADIRRRLGIKDEEPLIGRPPPRPSARAIMYLH
ncbi:YgaP-like transmembrane domain [Stigmatella erecta]|uniref:Inner membrane protein YgaP-like transmembrane domain-containing protein n=1 Tax=Stigmatella erecta TaxID=83460 RepID=A0A1I0ILY8_9BACT|nr:YgaP-like transmembrane domain [Stigmatella erecta]SET97341.1 Protein of unknown function [Stigmatella erecta]